MKRRTLLKGALAAAAVSPLLRNFSVAADPNRPKRVVFFFTPNGTVKSQWFPNLAAGQETLTEASFGQILQPLIAHRDKLIITGSTLEQGLIWNPDNGIDRHGINIDTDMQSGHTTATILTGTFPTPDTRGGSTEQYINGGPSLDQVIADQIGTTTRFRSLELGVKLQDNPHRGLNRMSFRQANQPGGVPPEDDPLRAFSTVFAGVGSSESPEQMAARIRRRSLLDFGRSELASYRNQLGTADRSRLDQHENAIRELEQTLTGPLTCSPPSMERSDYVDVQSILPAHFEIIARSFACDLTRVASVMVGGGLSKIRYPWLGSTSEHHELSHMEGEEGSRNHLVQINRWYAQCFADFLTDLSNTPDGQGTLMDNTLVVWVNENSNGNGHTRQNIPILMAGSADGYFRTGRYVRLPGNGRPHNDLLLSIAQAMGLSATTFGDPAHCTGPIAELR